MAPGQRWREELKKAGERCAAVIVLVSPAWADSKWCITEFLFAAQLGKQIFPLLVEPCPLSLLPVELTSTYQFADISTTEKRHDGFDRLAIGMHRAGLRPGAFPWPPEGEPNRPLYRGLRMLEEPDAAIYFGRDTQITKALDTIRQMRDRTAERMLVILGASGAGKSRASWKISSTRRAQRLAQAGRLPGIEVGEALQDELSARNRWISSRASYRRRLDGFKLQLGLPPDAPLVVSTARLPLKRLL